MKIQRILEPRDLRMTASPIRVPKSCGRVTHLNPWVLFCCSAQLVLSSLRPRAYLHSERCCHAVNAMSCEKESVFRCPLQRR